jgi:glycosyltransferase involved in cell wall biosynthesis
MHVTINNNLSESAKQRFRSLELIKKHEVKNPLASVLVRVKNEAVALPRFIKSLLAQSIIGELEVIFLDSGSTDGTLKLLSEFPCTVYTIASSEFSFGDTCNLMCELSRAEYCIFFSGHVAFEDANLLEVGLGRMVADDLGASYFRQIPNIQLGCSSYEKAFLRHRYPSGSYRLIASGESSFSNAASILRRSAWEKRGFPLVIASEDILWLKSHTEADFKTGYLADLTVEHSHNETPAQVRKRVSINVAAQLGKKMYPMRALKVFLGVFVYTLAVSRNVRESLTYARAHSSAYLTR